MPGPAVSAPILIKSIPKSGTYFAGTMLTIVGLPATAYHLRSQFYWQWPATASPDDVIRDPGAFRHDAPLTETVRHIGPGFT